MANGRIDINVTHSILGSNSSNTTASQINKSYEDNLKDLTIAIRDLNKNFTARATSAKQDPVLTYEGLKASANRATESRLNDKLSDENSFRNVAEDFKRAVEEFNKGQEKYSTAIKDIYNKHGAGMAVTAGVAGYSFNNYLNSYNQGRYLTARNDLTNPVTYSQTQAQTDYDKSKSKWQMLIGGGASAIGSIFGGPITGAAAGAAATKATGWVYDTYNQEALGNKQLQLQQNQISTDLSRRNYTGQILGALNEGVTTQPGKYGLLANQFPYMSNINAYRGNLNSDELTKVASFNRRYGIEGQQAGDTSTLIAQMSAYFPDITSTLHSIDEFAQQNGGDVSQQLATAVQLLQSGLSPHQALSEAFSSGYKGQAFQQAQLAYNQSPFVQRVQQEALSGFFGFNLSNYYNGKLSPKEQARVNEMQEASQGTFNLHGINQMMGYKGFIPSVISDTLGLPRRSSSNPMPNGTGLGSYDDLGRSKAETKSIVDKLNTHNVKSNKLTSDMFGLGDIDHSSEDAIYNHYRENTYALKQHQLNIPKAREAAIHQTQQDISNTHDSQMKSLLQKLIIELQKNTQAQNKSNKGL